MEKKKGKYFLLSFLVVPTTVSALSYNSGISASSLVNINAISQVGAVMNDTSKSSNLNIIIIGMVVIILILVGAVMFAPKK